MSDFGELPTIHDRWMSKPHSLTSRLYALLSFSLTMAVYEDAERFLQKLKRTPMILAASPPVSR